MAKRKVRNGRPAQQSSANSTKLVMPEDPPSGLSVEQAERLPGRGPGRAITIVVLVAVPLLVAAIGVLPQLTGRRSDDPAPTPSSTPTCTDTATIDGADTAASSFRFDVVTACPPPSDHKRFVIVQFLNEGAPGTAKHSEYYVAYDLAPGARHQTFQDSPHGCVERRFYVVSLTDDALDSIKTSPRTKAGAYYGEPIDTQLPRYTISNINENRTCNPS